MISIWMDEMGIVSNPSMRKLVKHYRTYFKAIDRREKIIRQNKIPAIPSQLHMAVMAAICGLKDAQPNIILRSVFKAGLELDNNAVYQDFLKYQANEVFWAMVRQRYGFTEEEPDLGRLAIHLLLTAATRTMQQEYLAGLDACEAATFSMYIDSRMNCYPCSFGIWNKEISESMKDKTLREIWRGKTFSAFREKSKEKCFNCKQKSLCQNGCRLGMNIELC